MTRQIGRPAEEECSEWLDKAGLQDVRILVQVQRIQYQGHDGMTPSVFDYLVFGEPEHGWEKLIASVQEQMIAQGFLDEDSLEQAKDKARAWYANPGAFRLFPEMFAAGQA